MQTTIISHVGRRVVVTTDLNEGRYVGREGTIEVEYTLLDPPRSRHVVKLDKWIPGLETADGRLYLNRDEFDLKAEKVTQYFETGVDSAGVEYEGPRFCLDDSVYYTIKSDLEGWEKMAWCILDQFDGGYIAFTTDEAAGERIVAALMKGEES